MIDCLNEASAQTPYSSGSTSPGKLKVGVIGYGYWGSKHVRVLTGMPNVEVTVVENRPQRLKDAAASFPNARLSSSLADASRNLDAVVIATPPCSHALVAKQALDSGLHTMVEKPMATASSDAELLVNTAERQGLTLMVGHTFEYNAAVWKLKKLITATDFGKILYIHTSRLSLGRYQNDCNVIWDLAPHDISIVSYLLDEYPSVAAAWTHRNVGDLPPDVAYLKLHFPRSSVAAFVHVSWLDPNKVRTVTVIGERKMAVYDDLATEERIRVYDVGVTPTQISENPAPFDIPVTYRTGDITSPYVEFPEPLTVQDSHFVDCVRSGSTPATDGQRGLGVVRVLEATDEALQTGAPSHVGSESHSRGVAGIAKGGVAS